MALWVDNGQHLESCPGVLLAVNPRDCEKMWQLPECEDGKQRPSFGCKVASGCRPAHQWRQRAGNGPDGSVQPSDALQGCVNKQVTDQAGCAKKASCQIDCQTQVNKPQHGAEDADEKNRLGLQAAGGQRQI